MKTNHGAGDTIIKDNPDALPDYTFGNTVNEKNCTESPPKSISKNENSSTIKIEIESGTEKKILYFGYTFSDDYNPRVP